MPSLYDYKVSLQHPATQLALKRLIDRELAHRETIAEALRGAAIMVLNEEVRERARAALLAIEASADDEAELRKFAVKLRGALARRKRAVTP